MNYIKNSEIYDYIREFDLSSEELLSSDFFLKIIVLHEWVKFRRKLLGREENENLVRCNKCNTIAVQTKKDSYEPVIYSYHCRFVEEEKLNCEELMVKYIIE
jgi:hypothetical protein